MAEQDPRAPQHGRASERRRVTALLLVLTAAGVVALAGPTAVVHGVGPELFARSTGGTIGIAVMRSCDAPHSDWETGPCFRAVNATLRYSDGRTEPVALEDHAMGWAGRVDLRMARATVVVETDLGTWTREIWSPAGGFEHVSVAADAPQRVPMVIGRDVGLALATGTGAFFALFLAMSAVRWGLKPSSGAAYALLGGLTLWLIVQVGYGIFAIFTTTFWILPVAMVFWLWYLRRQVGEWVRRNEGTPASKE